MKNNFKIGIFYVLLIAVIIFATASLFSGMPSEELVYSDIRSYFTNEEVKSFILDEDVLEMELHSGETVTYELRDVSFFVAEFRDIIAEQYDSGIIEEYDYPKPYELPFWVSFLPYIIVIVLFVVIMFVTMNQMGGGKNGKGPGGFGRARAKMHTADMPKVLFKDVAGADEEKQELEEIVEFLKEPEFFTKLGAKIPHGVLLMGPPGTGKTLLAKAVAGEAGVPFYSISGSDFVEMYVGVGASRVRDLFETARKSPAAIIFIDEIDAVGRHRGAGLGGGHDEREQTLNQLLVEMDGFSGNEGVIVMAATNRPDILDPALLRPGRFDRQITVNYPDLKGRVDILKVHARNKHFENDVDMEKVAQTTVGFTGADLANLLNEAALTAARKGKSLIGMNDIEEATLKVIVGVPKKNRMKDKEKLNTAYHEAGHAILAHVLETQDPVTQISIIPAGRALGFTLNPPVEDKFSERCRELKEDIVMLLGGRAAESIIFGDVTGGASNDIQRATAIARKMVTQLGMSDVLGTIAYGGSHGQDEVFLGRDFNNTKDYSEQTAALIDSEIKRIVTEGYEMAEKLLRENIGKLHFIAEYLVKNETMDGEQFIRVMDGEPTIEELEDMVADKKRRSEEENRIRAEHIKKREAEREAARAAEERKKAERARNDMPPFNENPTGQGHFGPPKSDPPSDRNDSDEDK